MTHHEFDAEHRAMTARDNRLTPRVNRVGSAPPSPPTFSALEMRAFTTAFERLGYDIGRLLAAAGLCPADLDDPDAMIPCAALGIVICAAVQQRRHANLAAHLAFATPIGAHPLLDYLVVTTDTVGGALDQLVRYFHVANAPASLSLVDDSDSVRLVVEPGNDAFIAQYETAMAVHHLRDETAHRLRISFVSLMHEPGDRHDLEQLLGCPVRVPSTWSGVAFPRDSLGLPLRRRDPALRRVLEGHAAMAGARSSVADDRSVVAQIRPVLASRLGRGIVSMASVARQLATTPRTLQRRLADEGISFQALVDVVRRERAERLLADHSLAVGEIGYLLGFSEPSAFHRAFKRWHDVTPLEYRRAQQQAPAAER
jgi:AraC-like DNA-binding protein